MKSTLRRHIAFFLPVLSVLVLPGCGDKDIPNPVDTEQSSMTAVVNGADWESSGGTYKLGNRTVTNGANAFVGPGDTLTIIGVQVQGADTSAILLSVELTPKKVGSYRLRSGTAGNGKAYFLNGASGNALKETKERYSSGITNGELLIAAYDSINYSVSGNFGFSMSAAGEKTYTVVAGKIENVTF